MTSISTLIDFLVSLMRDDEAQAAFEQNPQTTLADNGLADVSGQDVRDARLVMADEGGVRPKDGATWSGSGGDDPAVEIRHTTRHYDVDDGYQPTHGAGQTVNLVNIDDRDTVFINDSFNSEDTVTIVDDSFNSDDDGLDNKGGDINESVVADDIDGQVGVDNSDTTEVDVVAIDADNAFNDSTDNSTDNSVHNSTDADVDVLAIEDSFNATTESTPSDVDESVEELAEDEPDLDPADAVVA